tara:strand:- start:20049 stop:20837 length:789 start_codon:yes stop_codon:yes gene_type:complete
MTFLEPIILGIIQGITEWLPISSEGITSLIMLKFFNKTLSEAVIYSIWLHLGTVLAAIIYFRKDLKQILKTLPSYIKNPKKKEYKLTNFLVLTTIITGIIGTPLLLYSLDKLPFTRGIAIALIGLFLVLTGILQLFAKKESQLQKEPTTVIAIITGIVQAFAALPGLSRSGLTTATLLFAKYDAKQALKLSFLMSIPIILVAQIGLGLLGEITFDFASLIAILFSFTFGLGTLKLFLRIAEKINFGWFCIGLGILSMLQLFF